MLKCPRETTQKVSEYTTVAPASTVRTGLLDPTTKTRLCMLVSHPSGVSWKGRTTKAKSAAWSVSFVTLTLRVWNWPGCTNKAGLDELPGAVLTRTELAAGRQQVM
mmetsp:Transcript_21766/g.43192  ORF Transcript_21766/g.43192 Transcript_21766/m.43192 type:complete len:106 (-) Transcript_21766:1181-1498(-)